MIRRERKLRPATVQLSSAAAASGRTGAFTSAASDEMDDLDAVAVGHRRLPVQRTGYDLQVALHRHLSRIERKRRDQLRDGGHRGQLPGLAVDGQPHGVCLWGRRAVYTRRPFATAAPMLKPVYVL